MCSKATGKSCSLQGILSKMAHDTHSMESRERVCLDTEDTENSQTCCGNAQLGSKVMKRWELTSSLRLFEER